MIALSFILFSCSIFFTQASYVDNLQKCSLKDNQCIINSFQKVLHDIGETGIEELELAPIDPMKITNVSVTFLDAITLTLTEGVIKGFKDCEVARFSIDVDKQLISEQFTCKEALTIKGQFVLGGTSPTLQQVFGSTSIGGHGKAKIKLEKATISLDLPVSVTKKDDGETYLKVTNKAKYTYDVKKASFDIKKLVIGNNDISQAVSSYLNSNWKTVIKSFGKAFVDKGVELILLFAQQFYDKVPTKLFVEEDLSSFISNE